MKCIKRVLPCLAALIGVLAMPLLSNAALVSHFTFDNDYTNAVSATLDSPSQTGTSIDNSVFAVGGGAVKFDGGAIPEYVDAGPNAAPNQNAAYYAATISFWFKASKDYDPASGFHDFMGQQNGNPASFGSDNRQSFAIETQSDGKLRIFIRSQDGAESNNRLRFAQDSTDPAEFLKYADGDWHQIAYSWRVNFGGLVSNQMYFDGLPIPTITQENTLDSNPTNSPLGPWEGPPGMFIGALNNRSFQGGSPNPTGHINGWMDDLRIYDEVLDDAAVASLYALGNPVPEPGSMILLVGSACGLLVVRRIRRG